MLQFERAIVTDIPGTTRDSLEELIDLNGIPVILVDTAGIHTTENKVEQIGIERTRAAIDQADLVLLVTDLVSGWQQDDELIARLVESKPHIMLANKSDLTPDVALDKHFGRRAYCRGEQQPGSTSPSQHRHTAFTKDTNGDRRRNTQGSMRGNENCLGQWSISALTGKGLNQLTATLENWVFNDPQSTNMAASLNQRQGELCRKAVESLNLAEYACNSGLPQDCLATDLKAAIDCLSEICGEAVSEEIIENVFANFCIGK